MDIIKRTSITIQRGFPGFNFYFLHPDGDFKLVYDVEPLSSIDKRFSQNLSQKPQNKDVSTRKYHTSSLNPSFKPAVSNLIKVKPIYFKPFYSSYTIKSLLSKQNIVLYNKKPFACAVKHFSMYSKELNFNSRLLELLYSDDTKKNIQINIENNLISNQNNLLSNKNLDFKNIDYTILNSNIIKIILDSKEDLFKLYKNHLFSLEKDLSQDPNVYKIFFYFYFYYYYYY